MSFTRLSVPVFFSSSRKYDFLRFEVVDGVGGWMRGVEVARDRDYNPSRDVTEKKQMRQRDERMTQIEISVICEKKKLRRVSKNRFNISPNLPPIRSSPNVGNIWFNVMLRIS
jgi:hypothetical protein